MPRPQPAPDLFIILCHAEARNHGLEQMPEHARCYARAKQIADEITRWFEHAAAGSNLMPPTLAAED